MKTLLERAKPELKQAIEKHRQSFPLSVEVLENELSKNIFVSDVPFHTILDIKGILRSNNFACEDHQVWNYFTREEA
jgi:hypothetical protein